MLIRKKKKTQQAQRLSGEKENGVWGHWLELGSISEWSKGMLGSRPCVLTYT